jgi:hypothetical protein
LAGALRFRHNSGRGAIFDGSAGVAPFGLAEKFYVRGLRAAETAGKISEQGVERQQGRVADARNQRFSSSARRAFTLSERVRWLGAGSRWCHRGMP